MTEQEMEKLGREVEAFRASYAGSIYAVRAGDFVKIGFTKGDVYERIAKLQTGCPLTLQLIATGPGGRFMERGIHQLLKNYKAHGEWFHMHPLVVESIQRFCTTRH